MIENCFYVLLRQIKRSRPDGAVRQEEKKILVLVAMHCASSNGNRRRYLLCSLHMRVKNREYKSGVLFRRRVVLLASCLELINDYSYAPRETHIAEISRDFSLRTNSSTKLELIFFSQKLPSEKNRPEIICRHRRRNKM